MSLAVRRFVVLAAIAALFASVAVVRATRVSAGDASAHALLRNADGLPVGEVKLTSDDGVVLIRAVAHGLPAGFHGFHIHGIGSCVAPAFTSAGGHYNPGAATHAGHAGDLPSLLVMEDGTGELRFKTDRVTIADLLAGSGTAFIVHALADNFGNVPVGTAASQYTANAADATTLTANTGNAGARIACGAIN